MNLFDPKPDEQMGPSFSKARHPETREILSGFDGVVRPGEMLRMFSLRTRVHSSS